jgi:hypothetical protein
MFSCKNAHNMVRRKIGLPFVGAQHAAPSQVRTRP